MFLQIVVQTIFVYSNFVHFFVPPLPPPPPLTLPPTPKKKLLTLLLESNSAKDLVCLIVGYYRLFVDANVSIFTWGEKKQQLHRVSAEEGLKRNSCGFFCFLFCFPKDGEELGGSSRKCVDPPALEVLFLPGITASC